MLLTESKLDDRSRSATKYETNHKVLSHASGQRNHTTEEETVRVKRTHPLVATSLLLAPLFASENRFHSLREADDANRGDFK